MKIVFLNKVFSGPLFFQIVKLLVPIWAMLFVFQPSPSHPEGENYLPAIAGRDGVSEQANLCMFGIRIHVSGSIALLKPN